MMKAGEDRCEDKSTPLSPYKRKADSEKSAENMLRLMREKSRRRREEEEKKSLRYRLQSLSYEELKDELRRAAGKDKAIKMEVALEMSLQAAIDFGVDEGNKRATELRYHQMDNIEGDEDKRRAFDEFYYGSTDELPEEDDTIGRYERIHASDDTPQNTGQGVSDHLANDEKMPSKVLFPDQKESTRGNDRGD